MSEETMGSGKKMARKSINIICFSHLRWDFVYQRPQHLLTRASACANVFFFEEPIFSQVAEPHLSETSQPGGVTILTPVLPHGSQGVSTVEMQQVLVDRFIKERQLKTFIAWYYTPMAMLFTSHLQPEVTIYDCMDQLSAFLGAPTEMVEQEARLFAKADVVFTGGRSLYEAKRDQHRNVHAFPSSVDHKHFGKSRRLGIDPGDQASIPHPRIGFFGVLDERLDRDLIREVAALKPDWHLVLIGPVVKIREDELPRAENIHYLGPKQYAELPEYLAHWEVTMLPFALNESTRFISPTKTPEYLSAGKPVVSTPINDVVEPYGRLGLAKIAASSGEFCTAVETLLEDSNPDRLKTVDEFLSHTSWDKTFEAMWKEVLRCRAHRLQSSRKSKPEFDYLIVGAGFAGSVLAERLASQSQARVLLIDKRPHIGGNAFDFYNTDGILIHQYGPHIFHTNAKKVFDYLSRFTEWRPYEHRVKTSVDGQLVPMPINVDTLNQVYGLHLDSSQVDEFLASMAEPVQEIVTSEDVVVSRIGRDLYNKFFRNYTRKQWGLDPSQLDASVAARVPVRTNHDDRYFTDQYQAMPLHGYTRMFENMLKQPGITIMLETSFEEVKDRFSFKKLIFTGPVDEYFNHCYGKLPYRSLRFEHQTHELDVFQPAAVVNYPNEHDYTRITEFKYLTGQEHAKTSVVYEYPQAEGDPYYPIPQPRNAELYARYKLLAEALPDVYFAGRLGTYKYYNMDQVVAQALTLFGRLEGSRDNALSLAPDKHTPSTSTETNKRLQTPTDDEDKAA